jgi:hypothetical protein
MKYVAYVLLGFSLLASILGLVYGLPRLGGHGVLTQVLAAVPGLLVGLGLLRRRGVPRWAGAVSLVALAIVGMKTSGDSDDLNNVMLCAFFGLFPALALLIRPYRRRSKA